MKTNTRRLCLLGLLTAISLIVFIIENALPPLPVFPYIKLGLANTITLFVLFLRKKGGIADCVLISVVRIVLGSVITGQPMTMVFSFAGALLSLIAVIGGRKIFDGRLVPVVSVMGAIAHNIGQLLVAVLVYGSMSMAYYLPFLIIGGTACGAVTGVAAMLLLKYHPKFIDSLKTDGGKYGKRKN